MSCVWKAGTHCPVLSQRRCDMLWLWEKGHIVRFCPKGRRQNQNGGRQKGRNNDDQGKTDTTPVTSDKTPGSVGVHKLAPEAGMFTKAKVNGVITNLLIDTGATVTLISTDFF